MLTHLQLANGGIVLILAISPIKSAPYPPKTREKKELILDQLFRFSVQIL